MYTPGQAADYRHLRSRFVEAIFSLTIGIIGCLVTLYYLILVSGYRTEDRTSPYLHGFDMITTESGILLTAVSTMFMLFLGEKIGYPLIHLVARTEDWGFAERMRRAMIIYGCCMSRRIQHAAALQEPPAGDKQYASPFPQKSEPVFWQTIPTPGGSSACLLPFLQHRPSASA